MTKNHILTQKHNIFELRNWAQLIFFATIMSATARIYSKFYSNKICGGTIKVNGEQFRNSK